MDSFDKQAQFGKVPMKIFEETKNSFYLHNLSGNPNARVRRVHKSVEP